MEKGIVFDSFPIFSELAQLLPTIAKELGCSADDLIVHDYLRLPADYMISGLRDHPYKYFGPLGEDMPVIAVRRKNGVGPIGYGVSFYTSREDPKLKYAIYTSKGDWQDFSYLVIAKGNMFRYRRICQKLTRLANPAQNPPVLADGLLESVVQSTIGFLRHSHAIEKYGVRIKRGIILAGPPGNGKTMLCRHIQKLCSQRGYHWGVISSAEIDRAYHDKELTDLFRSFTVTFFDDIDVGYMDRSKGNGKMACSLLTAMDGISDGGHLVRIFTTNEELEELDPAFLRPGRIDQCYTLVAPTAIFRRKLVEKAWPQEIQDNIDIDYLVDNSENFSFAEMEAIRTFLVTNKVLGDGTWDLDRAFEEFELRREEKKAKKKKAAGFVSETKRRKSLKPPKAACGNGQSPSGFHI